MCWCKCCGKLWPNLFTAPKVQFLPTSATSPMLPGRVSLSTFVVPATVSEEQRGASWMREVVESENLHLKLARLEEAFGNFFFDHWPCFLTPGLFFVDPWPVFLTTVFWPLTSFFDPWPVFLTTDLFFWPLATLFFTPGHPVFLTTSDSVSVLLLLLLLFDIIQNASMTELSLSQVWQKRSSQVPVATNLHSVFLVLPVRAPDLLRHPVLDFISARRLCCFHALHLPIPTLSFGSSYIKSTPWLIIGKGFLIFLWDRLAQQNPPPKKKHQRVKDRARQMQWYQEFFEPLQGLTASLILYILIKIHSQHCFTIAWRAPTQNNIQ